MALVTFGDRRSVLMTVTPGAKGPPCRRAHAIGRPVTETGFVLVCDPTRLVGALSGDIREHRVPLAADAGIIEFALRLAIGIDQAEITIDHLDGARRRGRQVTAIQAGVTSDT